MSHEATTLRTCYQCGREFEVYPSEISRVAAEGSQLLCRAECVAAYERHDHALMDAREADDQDRADAGDHTE